MQKLVEQIWHNKYTDATEINYNDSLGILEGYGLFSLKPARTYSWKLFVVRTSVMELLSINVGNAIFRGIKKRKHRYGNHL